MLTILFRLVSELEPLCQMIIEFVPAEFLFELMDHGGVIYRQILDSGDLREIFQLLHRHRLAETGVMGPACQNPSLRRHPQTGLGYPNRTGYG